MLPGPIDSQTKSAGPCLLLARGTKAAGVGVARFLTIGGHASEAMLLGLERAHVPCRSPPPDPGLRIRYITKNRFISVPWGGAASERAWWEESRVLWRCWDPKTIRKTINRFKTIK